MVLAFFEKKIEILNIYEKLYSVTLSLERVELRNRKDSFDASVNKYTPDNRLRI